MAARVRRGAASRTLLAVSIAAAAVVGCRFDPQLEGRPCAATPPHCPGALVCVDGLCARRPAPGDGTHVIAPASDGGADAGGRADAPSSSGTDGARTDAPAPIEAGAAGGIDGGHDPGPDAAPPARADAAVDVAGDRPSDGAADPCRETCVPGARRCTSDGRIEGCVQQGACPAWSASSCSGNQSCTPTPMGAACCPQQPAGCGGTPGARCTDGVAVTCARNAAGCLELSEANCMAMGRRCQVDGATAACVCPQVPGCATEASSFCEADQVGQCGRASNGCLTVARFTPCQAPFICKQAGTTASCQPR